MAPLASVPTTSHGPMIQPMSANQKSRSPGRDVELEGDLLGHLGEEAAVHVHRALGAPGGARRVGDEERVLAVDGQRGERARAAIGRAATRPSCSRLKTRSPRRGTTTIVSTVGAAARPARPPCTMLARLCRAR